MIQNSDKAMKVMRGSDGMGFSALVDTLEVSAERRDVCRSLDGQNGNIVFLTEGLCGLCDRCGR